MPPVYFFWASLVQGLVPPMLFIPMQSDVTVHVMVDSMPRASPRPSQGVTTSMAIQCRGSALSVLLRRIGTGQAKRSFVAYFSYVAARNTYDIIFSRDKSLHLVYS